MPETYWVTASRADPARFLALRASAHSVGHHRQIGESLGSRHEVLGPGETGLVDHHLLAQRADQEVVLVVGADSAGVGETVGIDLVVERLSGDGAKWRGHLGGGHEALRFAEGDRPNLGLARRIGQ